MFKRLSIITIVSGIVFSLMYMRIFQLMVGTELQDVGIKTGMYNVTLPKSYPTVYDCNMQPLNNQEYRVLAVVKPDADTIKKLLPYVKDIKLFYEKAEDGTPFICEVKKEDIISDGVYTFKIPIRNTDNQMAVHILGYRDIDKGVSGIERAFNDFFEENANRISVRFSADANNRILEGKGISIDVGNSAKTGLVTTIDSNIQKIAEKASEKIEKGAVVIMDVKTGEIKASVSVPTFSPNNVESYLDDSSSPMINRAFTDYSVGSVFKMVTAATAIEAGISPDFQYECKGHTQIGNKQFNCHKHDGHGMLDMQGAVAESCNTYFIELSKLISNEDFVSKASAFGFGRKFYFAENYSSSEGFLQSISDLANEGEKANMSFGQGKLTATPIQVAAMTCAIANYGKMPQPKLIIGKTYNGLDIDERQENIYTNVIKPSTAIILRDFMAETINSKSTVSAKPVNTTAGGKTSTAQTGRYDKDGKEYLNGWFTGYFPELNPKYAVTIMVEDGGSGILSAGPVFKEIAENITIYEQGTTEENNEIKK